LARLHAAAYQRLRAQVRPLPGARELLAALSNAGIRWAIATSGRMETAAINLEALGVDPAKNVVVTRDQVKYAKPDPDLFLTAAA
ncbi:HAD family hydrolase, partial [Aeromonas veronii]